jgi:hypothetical protein
MQSAAALVAPGVVEKFGHLGHVFNAAQYEIGIAPVGR